MQRRAFIFITFLSGCELVAGSFEGTACDSAHPCPQGLVCGDGTCQINASTSTFGVTDDFESSSFNTDPYRWDVSVLAGDSVGIVAAAAHRGDGGFRSVDTRTVMNNEFTAYVSTHWLQGEYDGDMFFRGWMRVVDSTGTDTEILKSEDPVFCCGQWDVVWYPDGSLRLGVWVSNTEFLQAFTDAGTFPIHQWHLLEVARRGSQTPDASVDLYVDGLDITRLEHFEGKQSSGGMDVGAFFQEQQATTLTIDWDDLRVSPNPNGTTLVPYASAALSSGACNEVDVRLQDVFGNARPAPYDVVLESDAGIFDDPSCTGGLPTLAANEARHTVYTTGGADFVVRQVDFLSAPVTVEAQGCGCSSSGGIAALGVWLLVRRRNGPLSSERPQRSRRASR